MLAIEGYYRTIAEAEDRFSELNSGGKLVGSLTSVTGVKVAIDLPATDLSCRRRRGRGLSTRTLPSKSAAISQDGPGATVYVLAWGETKSVYAWSKDSRAKTSALTIRRRLLVNGAQWTAEAAISTPAKLIRSTVVNKERYALEAFGERKSIREWCLDPRCEVSIPILRDRLKRGITPPLAFQKELPRELQRWRFYEAFGERKTLPEWTRDPRCVVSYQHVVAQLKEGRELEEILTTPFAGKRKLYEAFGESKTISAWARDPRCKVSKNSLQYRLLQGMDMETALTKPKKSDN